MKTDWADLTSADAAEALWGRYEGQAWTRLRHHQDSDRLFRGTELRGLVGVYEPSSFNVIQSITETIAAHTANNAVLPMFLTEAGDYETQLRAQAAEYAIRGLFESTGIYGDLGQHVCLDGYVFGTAGVKVVIDFEGRRLLHERVMAHHLRVIESETQWSEPRSLAHVAPMDRGRAIELWPDHADDIESAPAVSYAQLADWGDTVLEDEPADQVQIMEIWHLPSGRVPDDEEAELDVTKVSHDGRRIVLLENTCLAIEPWPYERFPIALFKPHPHRRGFWGRGIPEQLVGQQLRINEYTRKIDEILNTHARPILYADRSSKINLNRVTNGPVRIIEGTGRGGLQLINTPSVPAELIAQRQARIQEAYDQYGISQLSSQSKKLPGIDHAPGMQLVLDTESVRHTGAFKAWERFHVDLAYLDVIGLQRLAQDDPDMTLVFADEKRLLKIKWAEVDLEKSTYQIKVWPVNLLSKTPSARRNEVADMVQQGLIPPEMAAQLLNFPDIEAAMGDAMAGKRNIESKLRYVIEGDEIAGIPHPLLPLEMAYQMGRDKLNALEADGADPAVLRRLRNWISNVRELSLRARAREAQAAEGQYQAPEAPPPDAAAAAE